MGNFRGRKLSRISQFCGYLRKFSPQNLGAWHLWQCKSEQSAKFSPRKSIFHQFAKVLSLESCLLYGTRPFPFLTTLSLPCTHSNNGRGVGMRLSPTLKCTLVNDEANHQCRHSFHHSNFNVDLPSLDTLLLSWQLIDKHLV